MRPTLNIDNVPLILVDHAPFLVVTFDNSLKFNQLRECTKQNLKIGRSPMLIKTNYPSRSFAQSIFH